MCWCGVGACPCLKCCPLLPSLGQEWSWSRAGRIVRECRHAYAADKEIVVTAGEAAGGWRLLDDWCKSAGCVCVCVDIAVLETPIMEAVDCGSKKASLFLDYNSCDKTIYCCEEVSKSLSAAAAAAWPTLSFHLIHWLIMSINFKKVLTIKRNEKNQIHKIRRKGGEKEDLKTHKCYTHIFTVFQLIHLFLI